MTSDSRSDAPADALGTASAASVDSANDGSLFETFRFTEGNPHIPERLMHLIRFGEAVVEVDSKLFFYVKAVMWPRIVFNAEDRFIFAVRDEPQQFADAYIQNGRFLIRPAGVVEN